MPKLLLYGQPEQVASLFFLSTAKKKVLKCLRLDNLHSVERKKKYLEGFSQEIRSLNAKKVFSSSSSSSPRVKYLFEMRVFDFGKCSKRCLASSLSGIQN
jgi:hypothetical protein